MIYLIDIDGTIADCSHRLHFIDGSDFIPTPYAVFTPDWNSFFKACVDDAPINPVIEVVKALRERGGNLIVFITGRSLLVQAETCHWLSSHGLPVSLQNLYMRTQGDHRPDRLVKSELFDRFLRDRDISDTSGIIVLDDRDQVVQMWRKRGIRCFQVADGNF